MKRRKVDSQRERRVLIGLIVSRRFLAQARRVLDDLDLLTVEHYKTVAKWCLDYHDEYGKAPGKHVEDLFQAWSEDNENEELVSSVKDFLEGLSEEYERGADLNVPYLLDDLRDFVTKRKLSQLRDSLDFALTSGNLKEAEEAAAAYRKVEVGQGSGSDPMTDKEGWKQAFSEDAEPIVTFEGDAGEFFNSVLTRDGLVTIQAPEKSGKTYLEIELAMRALRQRRRVAFFEVGDLSEAQLRRRLGMRWAGRPMWRRQTEKPIMVPSSIEFDESEETGYVIQSEAKRVNDIISYESVQRGIKRFRRAFGLGKIESYLRTSVHPTKTLNVKGIDDILDQWEQDHGFVADVIVVDYADILAPERVLKDFRHQVDETWAALRALSQKRHGLIITATQTNSTTYKLSGDKLQTKANFSEDHRKIAHVTAMLGINQTPEEKAMQGMRLNWIAVRESDFNQSRPLYVGTCLALGRAICCAKFASSPDGSCDNP